MRFHRDVGSLLALFLISTGMAYAQSADLGVAKSAPGTALVDSDVTYSLTVVNAGPDAQLNAQLTDSIPAGMTFVSLTQTSGPMFGCSSPPVGSGGVVTCSVAALSAGQSADFTLITHIPPATPVGTTFTNVATVSGTVLDPNSENDSAAAATTVPAPTSDLFVAKTAPGSAGPDTDVVFSITIGNGGPDDAVSFSLDDTLPGDMTFVSVVQNSGPALVCTAPPAGSGGTISCTSPSFPAGATATLALTGHVPAGAASGTLYSNTATVSSDTQDLNGKNNIAGSNTFVSNVDVSIVKSGPATANAGANVTYTLTVANAGPDNAIDTQFSDSLPAQTTFVSLTQNSGPTFNCSLPGVGSNGTIACSIPILASAANAVFTLVLAIDANQPSGTTVNNTAAVGTSSFDRNGSNNASTVATSVTGTADLAVVKSAPTSVAAGQDATYTLTLSSDGADPALSTLLTDALPANTTFVSLAQSGAALTCSTPATGANGTVSCSTAALASGATTVLTLVVNIANTAVHGATIVNTVNATTTSPESDASNNSASASSTVVNQADLGVTKSGPITAVAGQNLSYTITASNNGPLSDNAVLTDILPAGTTFVSLTQTAGSVFSCTTPAVGSGGTINCANAAFANGASASFTLVLAVGSGLANGSQLSNTTSIDGPRADPNPANDTATTTATVSNLADVAVSKNGAATVAPGQNLVYTIAARNDGASPALATTLSDTLPAATTFVSLQQNSGPIFTCTMPAVGAAGTVSCSNASFSSLAAASFTLTVQVAAATPDGTTITNTATIATSSAESTTANNSSSSSATAANSADLVMAKSGPASVVAGENATYMLTLSNAGPTQATGVQLSDPLPGATTFVSLTQTAGPGFTCTTPIVGATGTVSCTAATFASGASAAFTLVVAVPATAANGSMLANTATASATSADPVAGNNSATSSALVANSIDLALTKTGPASANPGQTITYSLSLANNGVSPAANVVLTDALPAQTTFASLTQNSGPAFACTTPAVNAAGTVTCTRASFPGGATATFALVVNLVPGASGSVVNTLSGSTSSTEVSAVNNASTSSATIAGSAALAIPRIVPTLSPFVLWLLVAVFAILAMSSIRRRASSR